MTHFPEGWRAIPDPEYPGQNINLYVRDCPGTEYVIVLAVMSARFQDEWQVLLLPADMAFTLQYEVDGEALAGWNPTMNLNEAVEYANDYANG